MARNYSRCPECGAPMEKAIAYAGNESPLWLECSRCNTFINTYVPQPHQMAVHKDPHLYIGNFGA